MVAGSDPTPPKDVVKVKDAKEVAEMEKYDLDKNPVQYRTWDGKLSTEAHDKEYMELTLRSGNHSDLVKKILRQRIDARAKDFPRWPADMYSGVRTVWIESRFWYDRERLGPDFDDDWRRYRAKYLHSLELDPREPVHVPEYERLMLNPIRRFYMKGGDWIETNIMEKISKDKMHATKNRVGLTRLFMMYIGCLSTYYWFKYNMQDWTRRSGTRYSWSRPEIYPNHPKFPFKDYRTEPAHHADYNFGRRTIFKDLRNFQDDTVVL